MAKIEIYSKAMCAYCDAAKNVFKLKGIDVIEYRVDQDPAKLEEMLKRVTARTMPQIFIDDRAIGGFTELKALDDSGELDSLLNT